MAYFQGQSRGPKSDGFESNFRNGDIGRGQESRTARTSSVSAIRVTVTVDVCASQSVRVW